MFLLWILLFSFRCSALPEALRLSVNSTHLDLIRHPQETCPIDTEELVSTLSGFLRCCNKCPAGEGMLQLCTEQTDTTCRPCQEGEDFSTEASATAKCMQCKQCQELHPFARFRKHCKPTSDAICECVSGYFFVETHSTCQSCTKCPPGYGTEKACDWNSDSDCKPCVVGTWSSIDSSSESCQTCRKCKPGQIEMRPCSATQNTLCCPLHNLNCHDTFREEESNYPKSTRRHERFPDDTAPSQMNYGDDHPMITIYCSLLGMIILTLLIYVFYKLWRQRILEDSAKTIQADVFPSAHTTLKFDKDDSNNSNTSSPLKGTADRQLLLGESHLPSYASQKSMIPDAILMDLSQKLVAENRWKDLGVLLGFSEESIQHFKISTASEEASTTKDLVIAAIWQMLTSWYSARVKTDPDPLTSLLTVLEGIPRSEYLPELCLTNDTQPCSSSLYSASSPLNGTTCSPEAPFSTSNN